MPVPWLVVLQSVPWSDVIKNAPKVAEGAKKLWSAVGKKPAPATLDAAPAEAALSPEARAIAALEGRLAQVEIAVADLHGQMLASSELIKALAEQNTQLVARIDANRVRSIWLVAALVVVGLVAVASLGLAFLWRPHV
jgi:hypothetical protein